MSAGEAGRAAEAAAAASEGIPEAAGLERIPPRRPVIVLPSEHGVPATVTSYCTPHKARNSDRVLVDQTVSVRCRGQPQQIINTTSRMRTFRARVNQSPSSQAGVVPRTAQLHYPCSVRNGHHTTRKALTHRTPSTVPVPKRARKHR